MPMAATAQPTARATRLRSTTSNDALEARRLRTVRQPFSYDRYDFTSAALERVSPNPETYTYGTDFLDMSYSGAGDVTAAPDRRRPQPGR